MQWLARALPSSDTASCGPRGRPAKRQSSTRLPAPPSDLGLSYRPCGTYPNQAPGLLVLLVWLDCSGLPTGCPAAIAPIDFNLSHLAISARLSCSDSAAARA